MPSRVTRTNPGFPEAPFRDNPLRQVRVLYVAFAKGLFRAAPAGAYHFSDGEESEIYISDEHPIQADRVGQRPAVSFTRSPVQLYSLGMDDLIRYDFRTGQKAKAVLVPGAMSINCCSRVDLESEHIAWIVAEHLWLLRERLLKQGFFEIGRQVQISSPSPAGSIVAGDGGDEWYCTTVVSPFQLPRLSQVTPLGRPILEGIEVELRAYLEKVAARGYPWAGHELPVSAQRCLPPSFAPNASDARGRAPDPLGELPPPPPTEPHPLNPSVRVTLRQVNPYSPKIRPPSLGGAALPIRDPCVKE